MPDCYCTQEEEDIDTMDCGELKTSVCITYSDQKECCEECLDSFVAMLSCVAETEGIQCPDLTCDGTHVLGGSGGTTSFCGTSGHAVVAIGIFILGLVVY